MHSNSRIRGMGIRGFSRNFDTGKVDFYGLDGEIAGSLTPQEVWDVADLLISVAEDVAVNS